MTRHISELSMEEVARIGRDAMKQAADDAARAGLPPAGHEVEVVLRTQAAEEPSRPQKAPVTSVPLKSQKAS